MALGDPDDGRIVLPECFELASRVFCAYGLCALNLYDVLLAIFFRDDVRNVLLALFSGDGERFKLEVGLYPTLSVVPSVSGRWPYPSLPPVD